MTAEELAAIKKRCDKATPGPWKFDAHSKCYIWEDDGICVAVVWHYRSPKENAEFIANARQDVPALLAQVERLMDENKLLQETLRAMSERVG